VTQLVDPLVLVYIIMTDNSISHSLH